MDRCQEHDCYQFNVDGSCRDCEIQQLKESNDRYREGLKDVEGLIDESDGVGGLHLNGDFATWEELRTGGQFEDWLFCFDEALQDSIEGDEGG